MKVIISILAGALLARLARRWWGSFQIAELRRICGNSPAKHVRCNPGKWGKRFKYLHNFLIETRLHLAAQLLYLKKDLLYFCLKHNILKFKSTPLGKCLQLLIDREEEIFKCRFTLRHQPFPLEFKDYLFGAFHPDPVIYGDDGGKREAAARDIAIEDPLD